MKKLFLMLFVILVAESLVQARYCRGSSDPLGACVGKNEGAPCRVCGSFVNGITPITSCKSGRCTTVTSEEGISVVCNVGQRELADL